MLGEGRFALMVAALRVRAGYISPRSAGRPGAGWAIVPPASVPVPAARCGGHTCGS